MMQSSGCVSVDIFGFFEHYANTFTKLFNMYYMICDRRLQRIQNQAARMLKRIPRRNHITPVLRELHWSRIHDRIIFKILLLTHKAVNNTAPEYVCDLITTIRTRASFDPCLLCVPPISKTCANSFFDIYFVYAAPTLWNALDLDIRLLPFDAFKKRVKTHLYLYFVN